MHIINIYRLNYIEQVSINNILKDLEQNYTSKFDLSNFKGIEIVDDSYLQNEYIISEGRTENGKILLPYSNVKKAIINANSDEYKDLKSTIYHELAHIDLRNRFPILHNLYDKLCNEEKYEKSYPIRIWIEYNAQIESDKIKVESVIKKYHKSICDYNWNLYKELHFINLIKHLPYIIVRINGKYLNKNIALSQIKNIEVQKIILDVEIILKKLSLMGYKDDYEFLKELTDYLELIQTKYNH